MTFTVSGMNTTSGQGWWNGKKKCTIIQICKPKIVLLISACGYQEAIIIKMYKNKNHLKQASEKKIVHFAASLNIEAYYAIKHILKIVYKTSINTRKCNFVNCNIRLR